MAKPTAARPMRLGEGRVAQIEDPARFKQRAKTTRKPEHELFYQMLDTMERGDVYSVTNYHANAEYARKRIDAYSRMAEGEGKLFGTKKHQKDGHTYVLIKRKV